VLPVSDELIRSVAGKYVNDFSADGMGWSNEFVCHVLEIKNNSPLPSFRGLAAMFHDQVKQINRLLEPMGGRLMPSGMHPWMNPLKETRIWPHRYRTVYETYHRIFNCRRHGWANVQSMHINISFRDDSEFARLHTALRLLIPVIPAMAASSPVVHGKITGLQDTRLAYYRKNQVKIPSIMGAVIPEPVFTKAAYEKIILKKMFRDIRALDGTGTLQHEWLNSRGAIPRYERNAMEVRVVDVQECPRADTALAELITGVLKLLTVDRWSSFDDQKRWETAALVPIFGKTIRHGDQAVIKNRQYLRMFGFSAPVARAGELWEHLLDASRKQGQVSKEHLPSLQHILKEGTLSRRILRSLGTNPSREGIQDVYGKLCQCLALNRLFRA
jgi:gamma-glutamyl:cysteine ligase YbdK (ATP-grasp superfamily)